MIRACTVFSKSAQRITEQLQRIFQATNKSETTALFCLSSNVHVADLEHVVQKLTSLSTNYVGCLSGPMNDSSDYIVCSASLFPSRNCIPWRSEVRGQKPVHVGRWHSFREAAEKSIHPSNGVIHGPSLPLEKIDSLVYLTDGDPKDLTGILAARYPTATQLSLRASHTPFLTGRPFTFFYNSKIYSDGAVGLALNESLRPSVSKFASPCLEPMGGIGRILKSNGNLIYEMDTGSPAALIVNGLQSLNVSNIEWKNERVFMGISASENIASGTYERFYEVLSGGPSRGTVALDGEISDLEGLACQFFRLKDRPDIPFQYRPSGTACLAFGVGADGLIPGDLGISEGSSDPHIIPNVLLAYGEEGWAVREADDKVQVSPSWSSRVPGSYSKLSWNVTS